MASVFTVLTKLEADVSNFTSGMGKVQTQLEDIQKSVEKTGTASTKNLKRTTGKAGALFKGLAGVAIGAMTAAAAAVGGVLASGIGRLTQIEEAQAKLTGLGNTTQSVSQIMDDALSAVRGTAFGMGEAATIAASAVAAGVQPGQELSKYLKTVADTAYIAGASMEEMGYVLNQTITSGRATNDTLQSLAGRGIPVYQMLGEQFGVTGEAIFEMASKGQISADMLQQALVEKIGGAALKSGDTVQGAFANMNAAFQRVGANIAGPIYDQFKDFFLDVIKAMEPFEEKAKEMGTVIGDALAPVMESLIDVVMPLIDLVFNLIAPLLQLVDAFKPLFDQVRPVADLFTKLVQIILPPLVSAIGMISQFAANLIDVLKPLAEQYLFTLANYVQKVVTPALEFLGAILNGTVIPIFQAFADFIGNNVTPIINGFVEVWSQVLLPAIQDFIAWVQPHLESLGSLFGDVFEHIGNAVEWAWNNILQPVFGGILDFFRDVLGIDVGFLAKIGTAFEKGFKTAQNAYKYAGAAIVEETTEIWDILEKDGAAAGVSTATALVTGMTGVLKGTGAKEARNAWRELFLGFSEDVAKQEARIKLASMGLSERLVEKILGDADWQTIFDKVIRGGQKTATNLQNSFNKTTEGIEEMTIALNAFTQKADEFNEKIKNMFDGFKILPTVEDNLGRFEKQIADFADTAENRLSEALSLQLITDQQKQSLMELVATHEKSMRAIARQRDNLDRQLADALAIEEYGEQFKDSAQEILASVQPLRYATREIGQFEGSVIDSFGKVAESINSAVKAGYLSEELSKSMSNLAAATAQQLRVIASQRDKLASEYQGFVEQLNAAKQFREATRQAAIGYSNITSLGTSARTILKNFGVMVKRTEQFRDDLSTLNQMGLNKELYNQILASGLDAGSATAKALLKGGPKAVNELNSMFSKLQTTADQMADETTQVMFDGGESTIQGFMDGVMAQDEQLRLQAEQVANAFASSFQFNLDLADTNIDALILSLKAQQSALEATATSLAQAFNTAFTSAVSTSVAANAPAAAPPRVDNSAAIAALDTKIANAQRYIRNINDDRKEAGALVKLEEYIVQRANLMNAATGGYIRGRGTGTSDSIPAMLSNGEFVMRAAAVEKFGAGFMSAINAGRVPSYATGGSVGRSRVVSGGGGKTIVNNKFEINVRTGIGDPAAIGKQVVSAIAAYEKTSGRRIIG